MSGLRGLIALLRPAGGRREQAAREDRASFRLLMPPLPIALTAILLLLPARPGSAQPLDANHPELIWRTMETEHFIVHYAAGTERTAATIAKIAEEIHDPITGLYGYAPDTKFHFIIKDTDDYANGAAYYYNNKMVIWSTALDYDLRGTVNWLRNVITHEYTHIIQLGAARKLPRNLPAIYLQVLAYEEEKRPDVLYGYPNVLASYPFAMTVMPMWFAEGTAQFNSPELRYDYWDSHRDMQLRIRALSDSLLPLREMEVFGKNSLGSEAVYNHGFSLVRYISETYGPDALARMTRGMKTLYRYDFNRAVKNAIGIDGEQLYAEWKDQLTRKYRERTAAIRAGEVSGRPLHREGYANFYPRWSPGGDTLYFSSNRGEDYLGERSIWRMPASGGKAKRVVEGASSPFDLTADGRWMIYSRIVRQKNESYFADLYLRDLRRDKEVRLTRMARAMDPSFAPDERSVVFIVNRDGTKNLATLPLPPREAWAKLKPLPAGSVRLLTRFTDGTQCWRPRFHPGGGWIAYARGVTVGRDIYRIRPDGTGERLLIGGPGDQRDPAFSPDGKWLYYADDHTGIFNLYRLRLDGEGEPEPLTNVLGGAFMPAPAGNGGVAYTEFGAKGFQLHVLDDPGPVDPAAMVYEPDFLQRLPLVTYDDTAVDTPAAEPYSNPFENLFFVPRIAFDYGTFKPGVYIFSSDFLEKLNLFAGFDLNTRGEFDILSMLEFRALRPTLFVEGYFLKRVDDERFRDPYVIVGETPDGRPIYDTYRIDYSFHLLEVDGGARMRLSTPLQLELRGIWSRYQAFQTFEDHSTFNYTYFIGRSVQARLDADFTQRRVGGNVHPRGGWRGQLTAAWENNKFIEGFEINADAFTLQEVYTPYRYWRFEGDATTWWNPLGRLVFQPRLRGGYLDRQVDPFMHLYAGGLHGMRGYSFYSLGGTRTFILSLALRHPLWRAGHRRIGWLRLDGIWGALFGDVGDAWRERGFTPEQAKRDIGLELRAKFYSWYGYPTAVTLSAARGFDTFSITENLRTTRYEPQWRYYLTVLFDFETIFPSAPFARR